MEETYIEEHANDAHNFLFVEVVKDFGHRLNDAKLKVSEIGQCKLVVAHDPQTASNIVGHVIVGQTLLLQKILQDHESALFHKLLCKFVVLQEEHQTVSHGSCTDKWSLGILAV